jgi:hypothetical protein
VHLNSVDGDGVWARLGKIGGSGTDGYDVVLLLVVIRFCKPPPSTTTVVCCMHDASRIHIGCI